MMLSLRIAYRYLRAKKSHRAVNVITLIAVTGIAIATMAMVLVLSIFNGFSDLAESQLSGLDPDIAVVPVSGKTTEDAEALAERLSGIEGVEGAFPTVTERALLVEGHVRVPVVVKGVPAGYDSVRPLDSIMIAGEYAEATNTGVPAAQLSVGVANQVSVQPSPGAILELFVPRRQGRVNPANPGAAFRREEVAFSGVFRVGNADIDGEYVIVPLEAARDLLDYDTEATSVDVLTEPGVSVEKVRGQIARMAGDGYRALTRLEQREDSFKMISIEKWVTFMMLVCILVIALFNVVSTLSLLAIEKRDNMATLRALGAPKRMIDRVFISEGFLVTVIGGALGIAAGLLLALAQQIFHFVKLSGDASSLTIPYYPVRVEPTDLAVIAGVIVLMALLVSGVARIIARNRD